MEDFCFSSSEHGHIYFPIHSSAPPSFSHMLNPHNRSVDLRQINPSGLLGLNAEAAPARNLADRGASLGEPATAGSAEVDPSEPTPEKKKKGEKKLRRPKYAFQTRSQVDILDDGYRWRKYGQKAVKNNKHPRSYYRCTHPSCNVKKQVQRLSKDEGIVVTTYEGIHTHPIEKPRENFETILSQMQIFGSL
ncbi:unnamed protein product [Victoria cruziana]